MTALGIRGVIEGFYGHPWTPDERLSMLAFMAEIDMNSYVYSPKDDPFTRRRWREPYRGEEAEALRALAAEASAANISLWYGISPGLSMRYSEPQDIADVTSKVTAVRDLGFDDIALFFDDIPAQLQHPGDRADFPDLVSAQLRLVGEIEAQLSGSALRFAVCPTEYWGHGDEPYIRTLGSKLGPSTELFWTGRAICSPELTAPEAEVFRAATGRRPLYWDNFPVNDVAMTHELHIGPYLGRDPGLGQAAAGIIANPMPFAEASKIGIASVADFARSPESFDAEASWESALRRVSGARDAESFREFADAFRGSALCADDAPRLAEVLGRFVFQYQFADASLAVRELRHQLDRLAAVAGRMRTLDNRALAAEISPWVDQYARAVAALDAAAAGLGRGVGGEAPQLDGAVRDAIAARLDEMRAARLRAFGDLVDMFLSDVIGEFTRR